MNTQKSKKGIAFFLAIVMLLTMLPVFGSLNAHALTGTSVSQIQFLGLGDWNYATASYNSSTRQFSLSTKRGSPHVYFNRTYTKITIKDSAGNVKLTHDYVGNVSQSSGTQTTTVAAGDIISIYACEPSRVRFYNGGVNVSNALQTQDSNVTIDYVVQADGSLAKPQTYDYQIRMLGLGDWTFATVDYNVAKQTLTIHTNPGQPHCYFSSTYAKISVVDGAGTVKFEKNYIGNVNQAADTTTLSLGSGYRINIVYAEHTRLRFYDVATGSLNNALQPAKDNVTTSYIATANGFALANGSRPAPTTPANLKAVSGGTDRINVSWNAAANATAYKLYRATSEAGTYSLIATQAATSFTDTGRTANTTYYYKVEAYNESGTSAQSAAVSAKTDALVIPATPANLKAVSGGTDRINVSWSAAANATGYKLYRATSEAGTYSLIATQAATSFTDTGRTANTTYYYKVEAYNGNGTSAQSAAVSAKTDAITMDYQIQMTGLSDWIFATVDYNVANQTLTVNTKAGQPHVYFSNSYAKITILDAAGNTKFTKDYVGNVQQTASSQTVNITSTDRIQIYYAEHTRLKFYNVAANSFDTSLQPTADAITTTYTATATGFQRLNSNDGKVTRRGIVISSVYDGAVCEKNNSGMANMFKKHGITTLAIVNRTLDQVKSAISTALSAADSDDVSYIYVNCHGGSWGYLSIGNNGGMSMAEFRNELDKIAGMKVLMLDSCHSGNAVNLALDGEDTEDVDPEEYCNNMLNAFLYPDGVAPLAGEFCTNNYKVLCSSDKANLSWAWANGYGWATYYWGLGAGWNIDTRSASGNGADANSDGKITLNELHSYAYPRIYNTGGKKQTSVCWPANDNTVIFQ